MDKFRVTMRCADCGLDERGWVEGRDGDEADPLLLAVAKGWEAFHADHNQVVIASPATDPSPHHVMPGESVEDYLERSDFTPCVHASLSPGEPPVLVVCADCRGRYQSGRWLWPWEPDEEMRASIERGLAQVAAGEVVDLGSFAQYLDDPPVVMCTTGGHEAEKAVGDALSEWPDEERYPYCAECLTGLGAAYKAHWWKPAGDDDGD